MKVDNAIIMAAGTSSRFSPLSYEKHKAMTEVRGEVLIERQIRQLKNAGIHDVFIITGYKSEQFDHLVSDFGVRLIHNPDYLSRNNNSSIWVARDVLSSTYICSADNYFTVNPFESETDGSYYAAQYAENETDEWCMTEDADGYISSVTIGGSHSWYMMGHAFWSSDFTGSFLRILENEYSFPDTADKLWERIFMDHLDELKMKIKKYEPGTIYEFDTLDELRLFDPSYVTDSRSAILKNIAEELNVSEADIFHISALKSGTSEAVGFTFECKDNRYEYIYNTGKTRIL